MQIEISSLCNKNCKRCYRTKSARQIGNMSLDIFKESIDKIEDSKKLTKFLYLAGFGESLLNPNFWDMVRYARIKNFSLMLPTNGTLLNEDTIAKMRMLNSVHLSIDDLNDASLNYLELFKKFKIHTQLNIVLNRDNYNNLRKFIHYGIKHNVKIYLMHTTPFDCSDKNLVEDFKFCIEKYNETFHMISQYFADVGLDVGCVSFDSCRYLNNDFAISWSGDLKPCNDGLLLDYNFGNIKDYSNIDAFLESDLYKSIVKGEHPICSNCKKIDSYIKTNLHRKLLYDERLDYFENLHNGKDCFVLGHAPTLTKDILEKLKDKITVSVNLIGHAKKWGFEPTYYAIGDCDMITKPDLRRFIDMLKSSVKFYPLSIFDQSAHSDKPESQLDDEDYQYLEKNMIPINWINPNIRHNQLTITNPEMISFNLRYGVVECGTSIQQMAIPIAAWLGCKNIYLAGCDVGYKGRFYDEKGTVTDWIPGDDIFRQYGWMAMKLAERNQNLYNIGPSKIPNVINKDIDEILKYDE